MESSRSAGSSNSSGHSRDVNQQSHEPNQSASRSSLLRDTFNNTVTQLVQMELKTKPKPGPEPGFRHGLLALVKSSALNVLLICVPLSWALYIILPHTTHHDALVFLFSFLAIVPLAKLLAFATDELKKRVGEVIGGILSATLGNIVELIIAIIALIKCQLDVVISSLVGVIIANMRELRSLVLPISKCCNILNPVSSRPGDIPVCGRRAPS